MKKTIIVVAIATLSGCSNTPISKTQLDSADYGQPMSEKQCTDVAENYIRSTLKDPFSAQFSSTGACTKGAMKQGFLQGGATFFGYLQKGAVNAKNSYGGYVGFRPYMAIIHDGIVVNYCIEDKDGICM